MAQDVKIIANVGYLKGLGGNGVIYAGRTEGGTYLFALQHLEGGVTTWRYYRKSRIQSGYDGGEVILQSDLNMNLFTDSESPDFVTESAETFKVITTVTNGDDLPRLFNLEPAYTLKGEGVVTADIDKLKVSSTSGTAGANTGSSTTGGTTTTGGTSSTGALGGLIPTDFSTLFSNPIKFFQDNMMFVLVVVFVIYMVRKKKKKPLWLF